MYGFFASTQPQPHPDIPQQTEKYQTTLDFFLLQTAANEVFLRAMKYFCEQGNGIFLRAQTKTPLCTARCTHGALVEYININIYVIHSVAYLTPKNKGV